MNKEKLQRIRNQKKKKKREEEKSSKTKKKEKKKKKRGKVFKMRIQKNLRGQRIMKKF